MPLALFDYFDRAFEQLGEAGWKPRRFRAPTLIPTNVLAQCDYLSSYPHNLTYACHLPEDPTIIEDFRTRHLDRSALVARDVAEMVPPEMCLSPAACYHVYYANRDSVLPAAGKTYGLVAKCFRYEAQNLLDLRRLWDFTMREVVWLGSSRQVLAERERAIQLVRAFLEEHQLAAEIRTASDPFFIASDAGAKTFFQLAWDTKFEVSMVLPDDARLAVGSFNFNTDYLGKAFNVRLETGEPMFSACVGFGIERWVYGFLAQHGTDPARWPEIVRRAPELARV
jgi:seryl-tRNA synthetase